ncbi:MAG: lysophospholipase [Spirochaetia bacterium]|nr:lysophospholipase [Spirochaetia bacterium]
MAFKMITGNFNSSVDRLDLHYRAYISKKYSPKKCIVIQHGFGEHSGRYQNVLDSFENTGYSLFIFDMRGHGLSKGIRGAGPAFDSFVKDLQSFIAYVQKKYKMEKPFLLGHSLGGLIALSYCLESKNERNIRALIVNGSLLAFQFTPVTRIKRAIGNLVTRFMPEIRANVGLNLKYISHDLETVQAYKNDPLVHGKIKISVADEIVKKGQWCLEHASEMKIPVLMTHGASDGISNPEGTIQFYENCGSIDKTLIIYDNLYHEIYNEKNNQQVFKDLIQWIDRRSRNK